MSSISGCTLTGDLPGQTHIRKTETSGNEAHQNVLAIWTQVKTLHKQQNPHVHRYTNQSGPMEYDTASTSNTELLECFQSKALRMIADTLWYMPNTFIRMVSKHQQLK
jgi:hypothetical protein